jgi:hypothetical protein
MPVFQLTQAIQSVSLCIKGIFSSTTKILKVHSDQHKMHLVSKEHNWHKNRSHARISPHPGYLKVYILQSLCITGILVLEQKIVNVHSDQHKMHQGKERKYWLKSC